MSFANGVVHIQATQSAKQLTIEPYTSYVYAPDNPDHTLVVTRVDHMVNFSLIRYDADGVYAGCESGSWYAQDIKQIVFDGSGVHAVLTVMPDEGTALPTKIQLVGDRANYSVFQISRSQFSADIWTKFGDDIRSLDGNADELILAPSTSPTTTDPSAASAPQVAPSAALPPFSTQPVVADNHKDDDALWA
jgi:hypothetical protein